MQMSPWYLFKDNSIPGKPGKEIFFRAPFHVKLVLRSKHQVAKPFLGNGGCADVCLKNYVQLWLLELEHRGMLTVITEVWVLHSKLFQQDEYFKLKANCPSHNNVLTILDTSTDVMKLSKCIYNFNSNGETHIDNYRYTQIAGKSW